MLAYLERCREELDAIQFSEDRMNRLDKELEKALVQAGEVGKELSARRHTAAEELAKRIQSELTQLDMPKVRFQVEFAPKDAPDGMDATGMDTVRFLMSANVGEALKPINKIASGGELSRIMLALKNVLAETEQVSTLIFDEVDTGVSGRAAVKVDPKAVPGVPRGGRCCASPTCPRSPPWERSIFPWRRGRPRGAPSPGWRGWTRRGGWTSWPA